MRETAENQTVNQIELKRLPAGGNDPYGSLAERVQRKILGSLRHRSEDDLWELVAGEFSDWQTARKSLAAAEEALENHARPLGAIGAALDGGELEKLEEGYVEALSAFTMINEKLRSDARLRDLMSTLSRYQHGVNERMASNLSNDPLKQRMTFNKNAVATRPFDAFTVVNSTLSRFLQTFKQPQTTLKPATTQKNQNTL